MDVIFDIETNGLYYETDTLHCIAIKEVGTDNTKVYTALPIQGSDGDINIAMDILCNAKTIIGHNIINFDIPTLKKLTGIDLWEHCNVLDTLLVSKLMYPVLAVTDSNRKTIPPKLKGSHSLKAWGYRLRKMKGTYGEQEEAWDKLTAEMVEYCRQDVEVNATMYDRFVNKGLPPEEAIWLEHQFAKIISRQEKYGWLFDVEKAKQLHVELLEEVDKAEAELFKVFTPLKDWVPQKETPQFTKSGAVSKNYEKQIAKGCCYNDDMEWGYYKEVVFNPTSRQHIARWLQEVYNWKPTTFTEKGGIKINEDVLNSLEFKEGKILAHYFNVKKLIGMIAEGDKAWLKMIKPDGRMHGSVDTLGAVSRRCTHRYPNLAQVPSPRAFRGKECRQLFTVEKGKKLVGCDMSGLELRVFAHYLARFDKGEYANVILNEDIHTFNQKSAGLPTRDMAKTMIYGTLYGAGDAKIGEIVSKGAEEGKKIKNNFKRNVPAYAKLLEGVQNTYKNKGYLKALDGNPYHIRSSHSALNTLLQGAGALICKQWLIETDIALQKKGYKPGIDYEFVSNVHDEFTSEVRAEIAEDVAKITEECCNKAGEFFNFRMRLDGEAKIGDNWYDIH